MEQNQKQVLGLSRDKYWKEKSSEEKLEVLADVLANAHRQIRTLTERLDELSSHSHHPVTSQLLVPARDRYGFDNGRIGPPGYNHEDFVLGRSPANLYDSPPATPSWQGEAQAEGALPTAGAEASPPTEALVAAGGPFQFQTNPLGGLDKPVEQPDGMGDPDWPQEPKNPQFHPTER